MKFTPGPWKIISHGGDLMVEASSGIVIDPDLGLHAESKPRAVANAYLIAAAPELYEALHNAARNGLIYWEPNTQRGQIAKAQMLASVGRLLAKARGER